MNKRSVLEPMSLSIASIAILAGVISCTSKKVVQENPQPPAVIIQQNVGRTPAPIFVESSREKVGLPMAHFAYDSAVLTTEAMALVRDEALQIKNSARAEVIVVGGCDERGSFDYNQKLGMRRAQAIRSELQKRGVPADLIRVESVGESQPVAIGHDEQSWAVNRRAEIHVSLKAPLAGR